jgi:3-hydroxymyristoyl/3-hydroxydecanoyl-(acyl carrier protein) dehydratase
MTMTSAPAEAIDEPVTLAVDQSNDRVELDLLIPANLSSFRGHFPELPILPGIVQVHWAIGFARLYFPIDASPPRAMQVKFRNVITPDERIRLVLTYAPDRRKLSFECRDAQAVRSSGVITFAP